MNTRKLFWGPPLWRQILIATVTAVLVATWCFVAPSVMDRADGASDERVRGSRHEYAKPRVERNRFRDGRYGNAQGVHLPPGTFRLAKRYCINHPNACPRSTPTRGDGDGCCWDWLEWTGDALKTTSCLAVILSQMWAGCGDQPEWVHKVRRVEVLCGGTAVIIMIGSHNVAAGLTAGAGCFWVGMNTNWIEGLL